MLGQYFHAMVRLLKCSYTKRRRKLKRQGGFALVELLTVVAILIILIGVVAMSIPDLDQLLVTLQFGATFNILGILG